MRHYTIDTPEKRQQYLQAAGRLPHTLTNDYLFKALLQENENVLRHLICSLLHLRPDELERVDIRNPILLGRAMSEDKDSKAFVLDLNVLLNDRTMVNLEMQVVDYKNWPERAASYLCRNFDSLSVGEDYIHVRPTIHIGFLDFTLFPEHPEFYATYKMMNIKSHQIFTDKLRLSVVNLKQTELATQEDREWGIDYWASLFKATTWEEIKMLAEKEPVLGDAAETIFGLTADESIREQCRAREMQVRELNTILLERDMATQERNMAFQERSAAFQERDTAFQERSAAFQERDTAFRERDTAVQERDTAVQERDAVTREKEELLKQIELLRQENTRLKVQERT